MIKAIILLQNDLLPTIPEKIQSAGKEFTQGTEMVLDKLLRWFDYLLLMLPNFILAGLVMIGFYFFTKLFKKNFTMLLGKVSKNEAASKIIAGVIRIFILLIGLSIALSVLKLDKAVSSLLAGAGILGLAIGFAFQDIAVNFISGVIIAVKRPFSIGDLIESTSYLGNVRAMDFRSVLLESQTGQIISLSNRSVLENPLINYSRTRKRRIDINVGVSYNDELKKVERVCLRAIKKLSVVDMQRPIDFFYEEFGDFSINFVVRFWVKFHHSYDYSHAKSEAIMSIYKAFKKENISIPFPVRTLEINRKTEVGKEVVNQEVNKELNKVQTRIF